MEVNRQQVIYSISLDPYNLCVMFTVKIGDTIWHRSRMDEQTEQVWLTVASQFNRARTALRNEERERVKSWIASL